MKESTRKNALVDTPFDCGHCYLYDDESQKVFKYFGSLSVLIGDYKKFGLCTSMDVEECDKLMLEHRPNIRTTLAHSLQRGIQSQNGA